MTTLSGVGIVGGQKGAGVSSTVVGGASTVPMTSVVRPTWATDTPAAYMPVGAKGGDWGVQGIQETPEADGMKEEKSLVAEIGEMTEGIDAQKDKEETILKERTEEGPPNPKKRMYEHENEKAPQKRDEL